MGKLINVIKDKYSIIPNEVFFDKRLDYRSRGVTMHYIFLAERLGVFDPRTGCISD